jgi:hypothetical protein
MPDEAERGRIVADTEDAYRAIIYPKQWAEATNRPSTAAFDEDFFSVDLRSRTTPEETVSRFRSVLHLVQFNCGEARKIGFETRDEPDHKFPRRTTSPEDNHEY